MGTWPHAVIRITELVSVFLYFQLYFNGRSEKASNAKIDKTKC